MAADYHGIKPVTEDDKKMAAKHLKATRNILNQKEDLLKSKIDDHKKALVQRIKVGDTKSANYNRGHIKGHVADLDDVDHEQHKIHNSLKTLSTLRTHSRKTYNDVRNMKVKLMYKKAGVKNGSPQ